MALGCVDMWCDPFVRAEIKETFGNYRNWSRFCAIADDMALGVWLSIVG